MTTPVLTDKIEEGARPEPAGPPPDRRLRRLLAFLASPGLVWYALFLAAPMAVLVVFSLGRRAPNGGYQAALTLDQFAGLGTRLTPFLNTVRLGLIGTLLCVIVAYPMAYFMATRGGRNKTLLLALVVIPFWTSFLIRTYAWVFLLGNRGLPEVLERIGIGNVRLLNTTFAVLLGIVYNYLPLMVLPIYVSLERVDVSLRHASKDLGAGPWATFRQVTLPLSAPGVVAGVLLVFVPVLGEYLIPVLLGGGQTYFLGNALADLFFQSRNWPFGAAVAVAFIAVIMVLIVVYTRMTKRIVAQGRGTRLL
ncbi:MAG TPA: ABC transporter permease [Acidimicrobiia bacterium]|nr:ABC transporter permease [Acidimicrobiia bacterium]